MYTQVPCLFSVLTLHCHSKLDAQEQFSNITTLLVFICIHFAISQSES